MKKREVISQQELEIERLKKSNATMSKEIQTLKRIRIEKSNFRLSESIELNKKYLDEIAILKKEREEYSAKYYILRDRLFRLDFPKFVPGVLTTFNYDAAESLRNDLGKEKLKID